MNTKTLLVCGLVCALTGSASACVNKSGTKYGGGKGSYFGGYDLRAALKRDLKTDGIEMEAALRDATRFEDRSDYSIALMFLGRSGEAVELLTKLEQEQPGKFFIAANLGTAYELSGDNAKALQWINEGIRRNPQDHEGTEWLHAKILEAKIAHQKDAKYFEQHSVLELHPSQLGDEVMIGGSARTPKELAKAIEYQLSERLQFVKNPDPAVASLLFDYASIEAVMTSMQSAKRILKMATDYGYPAAKVAALAQEFDRRLFWDRVKFWSLIVIPTIGVLAVLYRLKLFVLSRKDLQAAS